MRMVTLPGSGRRTTQLGFGCGHLTPEESALLEVAYDAGVRHFDVARAYGRGLTESVVGRFLRRHPDCTVTTKFGIAAPFSHPFHAVLRKAVRPLLTRLRRAPAANARINRLHVAQNHKASFTAMQAMDSLRLSLRNLGRQQVDLFLMHEPDPEDLAEPALLRALEDCVRNGRIGAFGVGGQRGHVERLVAELPAFCRILQYDWTPLDPIPVHAASLSIAYRTFGGPVAAILTRLRADSMLSAACSRTLGIDLFEPGRLEQLMLRAALDLRPDTIVLFSSSKPSRLLRNVAYATDPKMSQPASRLLEIMRTGLFLQDQTVT